MPALAGRRGTPPRPADGSTRRGPPGPTTSCLLARRTGYLPPEAETAMKCLIGRNRHKGGDVYLCILPGWLVRWLDPEPARQVSWNVLLSSLLVLVLIPFATMICRLADSLPHFCLAREFLGLPCPGCGMTRSLVALSQGDMEVSWNYNSAGIALLVGTLAQAGWQTLVLGLHMSSGAWYQGTRAISHCVLVALVGSWVLRLFT